MTELQASPNTNPQPDRNAEFGTPKVRYGHLCDTCSTRDTCNFYAMHVAPLETTVTACMEYVKRVAEGEEQ